MKIRASLSTNHPCFIDFTRICDSRIPSLNASFGFGIVQLQVFRGLSKRHIIFRNVIRTSEVSYHTGRSGNPHVTNDR